MGKRSYAEKLYKNFDFVYDLENENLENIKNHSGLILILNLQAGVKNLLQKNQNVLETFENKLEILRNSILTGDEISSGVIPVSKFERQWRDETGKLYQFLAGEADIVDRIFAGLPLRLKNKREEKN